MRWRDLGAAGRRTIRTLERSYAKAGIPERYRGDLDDTLHEFNAAMQQRARAWLDRWLRA